MKDDQTKELLKAMMKASQQNQLTLPGLDTGDVNQLNLGPVKKMEEAMERLGLGMEAMGEVTQKIGQVVDVQSLKLNMILNILVDKGIVTEEEIKAKYETDVLENIKKIREIYQKQMQEAQNATQQKEQCDSCEPCTCDEKTPVLASEKNNVITFPTKK
jgi:hypothetical protein